MHHAWTFSGGLHNDARWSLQITVLGLTSVRSYLTSSEAGSCNNKTPDLLINSQRRVHCLSLSPRLAGRLIPDHPLPNGLLRPHTGATAPIISV